MADGQLKLFKGDKQTFSSINDSNEKKISEGNLIVAKENSSSGDLYIDYSSTERLHLASNKAIIGTSYDKQTNNNNYALFGSNLKGENNVLLEVDSTLNANSTHPVQNAPVANAISSHATSIGELNSWKTSASSAISTLQTDVDNVEKDISTRIDPILSGLNDTIGTVAAAKINELIDAADNPDTINDINSLVQYVNDNAGDIAALVAEVGEKAEYQEISRAAYDALSIEEKMNGTIYLIYDEDGYISSSVDIIGLQNRVASLENRMPTTAAHLSYSNTTTGMTAATVQAAIDELYNNTQVALGDIEALLAQI